jgi:hypothetical protein
MITCRISYIIFGYLLFWGCTEQLRIIAHEKPRPEQCPATIFIHGTLPPLVDKLTHWKDVPLGLTRACKNQGYINARVPCLLQESSNEFPFNSFYLFGWSGDLSCSARKKAAQELYQTVKTWRVPLTIIGHSHGCNVALNIAESAQADGNKDFSIDRLILLACPVQLETERFIRSPVFKRIYSMYSCGDLTQVLDPQGLHVSDTHNSEKKVPLLSQRTFIPHPHLVQIQVFIGKRSPGHIDFILKRFLRGLSQIIKIADEQNQPSLSINIPVKKQKVHIWHKKRGITYMTSPTIIADSRLESIPPKTA